ncbi:MAG: PAS domain-containing protein [Ferruginibacter sp.]
MLKNITQQIKTAADLSLPLRIGPANFINTFPAINSFERLEDPGYINPGEKGAAMHLTNVAHDLKERKNAAEEILLSEQRFKSLIQNSRELIAILDPQGNYTYVNPTSRNVLGYEPEFLIGKNTFEFIHEDDVPKMLECLSALATQKFVESPLFRFRNISGEWPSS